MGIGFTEIALIFLLVLLFFGAKRLPEVAKAMGRAVGEFRKAKDDFWAASESESTNGVVNTEKSDSKSANASEEAKPIQAEIEGCQNPESTNALDKE